MQNRFKFPCNYNNPIKTEKVYTMKKTDSNFVAQCLLVTAVLLTIAWYVLSVSGLHVTRFFSESVNFYGIIAFVLALYSLWYTYQSYVSQRRTEINTENVPVDHQKKKFEGLTRHEYRNLVCVLASAMRFFDERNGSEKSRSAYPSESNVLKLQAAPQDFVLDINAQMASAVSEMRLLLRNANIEITVAIEHLSRRDINDDTLYQDYDNLMYKPLYLVRRACEMETLLTDDNKQDNNATKELLKELIKRTARIMVTEHLKKIPESLHRFLMQDEGDCKNHNRRSCMPYLQLMAMSNNLNFQGIDHTGALSRSFRYLCKDLVDENTGQMMKLQELLSWTYDDSIRGYIDKMASQLQAMEQDAPEYAEYFQNYKDLLNDFKEKKKIDFVAFFPSMLLLDAIVETPTIGMVNYRNI